MKLVNRILFAGIALAAGTLLAGCYSDEKFLPSGGDTGSVQVRPQIIAGIVGETISSFSAGDSIGVYPVNYVDGGSGTLGDISNPMNVKFTFDGSRWETDPGQELFLDGSATDLYAYWPYDAGMSVSAYPVDLSGDQTGRRIDFLWARAGSVSDDNPTARMLFRHLLARFEIRLSYDEPQDDASVTIYNTATRCTIDLRSGRATTDTVQGITLAVKTEGATASTEWVFEAIMAPQAIAGGTPLMAISYNGDVTVFYPKEDIVVEAGKNYIFNLIVGSIPYGRTACYEKVF